MAHAPRTATAPATPAIGGIQFPTGADGQRSSSATGKAIFGAALAVLDAPAAASLQAERNWRKRYAQHLHHLTAAMLAQPEQTAAAAQAGLDATHAAFVFSRDGAERPLAQAMAQPSSALKTSEIPGRAAPAGWTVPYRGQSLSGDALRRQIDDWLARELLEPGAAAALHRASGEPGWFDLRDRSIALLGAGAEAGPLRWLTAWGARVAAIDLPREAIFTRIRSLAEQGAGTVLAPQAAEGAVPGADLLADTPELAAWLCEVFAPPSGELDLLALAYADGERHARVAVAMDALIAAVQVRHPKAGVGFLATPTDSFAVPPEVAAAGRARWAARGVGARLAHALSAGQAFAPNLTESIDVAGQAWSITECSVLQQGPNYALAKRLQHWRALASAAAGRAVSINVAPSTNTWSVVKNRLLAAGFAGADLFGVEVFEPETTNALMAALWVHDLRTRSAPSAAAARPAVGAAHPLALLSHQSFHGGLWRLPYVPASALAVAALAGLARGRKH
ncbi:hypothetical protein [Piscinibacterium candidicorallinum]|uniref:Class I SAM-dependent methyltransferase n=1 Tax=Piscinibacterium candidicorallinum TaxID=1793872 RepID=A0ABV7H479_9BURK